VPSTLIPASLRASADNTVATNATQYTAPLSGRVRTSSAKEWFPAMSTIGGTSAATAATHRYRSGAISSA